MEIKAKCKFDFDSIRALTHLTMFKKANPKKRLIFWSVVFAILFVVIILEIIAFGMDLILLVLLGGGIGGIAGIYTFRHKTQKAYFKYGFPIIIVAQIIAIVWFFATK